MITLDALILTVGGIERAEIEDCIAQDWVRPAGTQGAWLFRDIDVARLRLIHELRHELHLEEDALPVVLHLLDQLYDTRRHLLRLRAAIEQTAPADLRAALLDAMRTGAGSGGYPEDAASDAAGIQL
ncbi:MAG: hypothetical protein KGJ41_15880 [Rhodospirillales bacterium]|nr:hypothetical protein [Rhodospirillales bacterium]MDE2574506.1 hypothetical protein [Rhodospirillales bacterium]